MEKVIYNVLKKLTDNGYESYVVGGYVRDKLLGKKSMDIDITTKARPKEVLELFPDYDVKLHEYGNVSFEVGDYKFDITTFRKDIKYRNNRKPESIEYIDSFEEDLLRRDFTINAICLDIHDKIVDLHEGRHDIRKKIVRSIGDADFKMEEDVLRILRAIRFASIFKFNIESNLKTAIMKHKDLLTNVSYERKREELNKIFCSKYKKYGIKLLIDFDLTSVLDLKNIEYANNTNDLIAIWAMITDQDYAFTKNEKDLIKNIRNLMNEDINDPLTQYKYGSYCVSAVSDLKGLNTKKIMSNYDKLPIKDRNEIAITADEICKLLDREPDSFLKTIFDDIEFLILKKIIKNDKRVLSEYIKQVY